MSQEFNEKLIRCLVETAIFLEFSDESVVDPDSSIEMLEVISSELQGLNSSDIKYFKEQIKEIANTYFDEKKEFVIGLPKYLGIENE